MTDEKKRILEMLSQGTITVDEAERLLKAMESAEASASADPVEDEPGEGRRKPKFLCIKVDACDCDETAGEAKDKVNIRIPLGLVKAGIKLGSVMPESAKAKVQAKFGARGIDLDLDKIKGKDIEEVLTHLCDANIDIESEKDSVRIYCE